MIINNILIEEENHILERIKNSAIKFSEGGAPMLAEISINHIKAIDGVINNNPLAINKLRVLNVS